MAAGFATPPGNRTRAAAAQLEILSSGFRVFGFQDTRVYRRLGFRGVVHQIENVERDLGYIGLRHFMGIRRGYEVG